MKPRLIALCSPVMSSGKSTAAQHLVDHHGFVRVAFAAPLKAMIEALLRSVGMRPGEIFRHVHGDMKEAVIPELGVTSRWLQQTLGTEWGRRTIRDTFWVDIAMAQLAAGHSVVIDDMRFRNEYDAVEAAGGDCYRVVRPEAAATTAAHASEGALDGIVMREIWNNGSVDDLYSAVDHTVFA